RLPRPPRRPAASERPRPASPDRPPPADGGHGGLGVPARPAHAARHPRRSADHLVDRVAGGGGPRRRRPDLHLRRGPAPAAGRRRPGSGAAALVAIVPWPGALLPPRPPRARAAEGLHRPRPVAGGRALADLTCVRLAVQSVSE